MTPGKMVVLTGGPGGGKSTLLDELGRDPDWRGRFSALPEAVSLMHTSGISSAERLFQRVLVHLQMSVEDGLQRALQDQAPRLILCNRGSLDPLAYWLARGWPEEEFFAYTHTCRQEHFRRYAAVIHLVTTADGAPQAYKHWPAAPRSETPEEAVTLDRLLEQVWRAHPHYVRIDNAGKDWTERQNEARMVLQKML
jgi:predicted ATPase